MKMLIHGRFFPSIGGIETVVNLLAREWAKAGDEVIIVSNLPGNINGNSAFPFRVLYQPSVLEWFRLVKWSEIVLHMNVSLKALWPHLVLSRPLVICHQAFYRSHRSYTSYTARDRFKLRMMPWAAANIAASRAISDSLPVACSVIPNPYDSTIFHRLESTRRDRDLVFVGRLVSEKGAGLLLRALAALKRTLPNIRLTIIGDGPERGALQKQTAEMRLPVCFAGALDQKQVASELRRHKILIVPSVYEEPFGVVALEGAACGCFVLGSDGGGLPEAMGPAGTTFRRGDLNDLCAKISAVFHSPPANTWSAIMGHLERHQPQQIAAEYRRVLGAVLRDPSSVSRCHDLRRTMARWRGLRS